MALAGCGSRSAADIEAGKKALDGKDYDLAVSCFTQAITSDSTSDEAYDLRGEARRKKGSYAESISDYTEAIRINPKQYKYYNGRARAYIGKDSLDDALRDANSAIELNPDSAGAYDVRGGVYLLVGQPQAAISSATKAIELEHEPKLKSEWYFGRSCAYERLFLASDRLPELDNATADAKESLSCDPTNADARILLDRLERERREKLPPTSH
jgi:tetratricopeptide (TPR) repeat protein